MQDRISEVPARELALDRVSAQASIAAPPLPKRPVLAVWFMVLGCLLVLMAFARRLLEPLPVSTGLVYLLIGLGLGPLGLRLLVVDPLQHAQWIEVATEIAVLISLFAVGLKIEVAFSRSAWAVPLRLATLGMLATIALIALAAHLILRIDWPLAILLGGVLAPTDPVLASDVQVREPGDRDKLRFSLTAEGGLNDGTAFPVVMLGLVLLGLRDGGAGGLLWLGRDLLWSTAAGLIIGWLAGQALARVMTRLRRRGHSVEFDEFLVLGTIALAYGVALLLQAYGFLAVFAAGVALCSGERRAVRAEDGSERGEARVENDGDPPLMAPRLLAFAEQSERIAEVAVVLLLGALLTQVQWSIPVVGFALLTLVVLRPLAVYSVLPQRMVLPRQRRLIAWFGVRGIGSTYYLAFALHHGVQDGAQPLIDATLATVALSILLHGTSATPLMHRYQRRTRASQR